MQTQLEARRSWGSTGVGGDRGFWTRVEAVGTKEVSGSVDQRWSPEWGSEWISIAGGTTAHKRQGHGRCLRNSWDPVGREGLAPGHRVRVGQKKSCQQVGYNPEFQVSTQSFGSGKKQKREVEVGGRAVGLSISRKGQSPIEVGTNGRRRGGGCRRRGWGARACLKRAPTPWHYGFCELYLNYFASTPRWATASIS